MKFRKATTFNSFDTSVSSPEGERHVIEHDVAKRCNIAIERLKKSVVAYQKRDRRCPQTLRGAGLRSASHTWQDEIVSYFQYLNPTYKVTDVTYVLRKLVNEGFLGAGDGAGPMTGKKFYYLKHDPRHVQIRFK